MFPEKKHKDDPTRHSRPDELLLLVATQAALQAGQAILRIYEKDFRVDYKTDQSPLTDADREAHRIIQEALTLTGLPVLSEEGTQPAYAERSQWQRFWLVDPLDGTKEFVSRNGEFTVNIALISEGKPLLGVVFAPVTGELYVALDTLGSFKITDTTRIPLPLTGVTDLTDLASRLPLTRDRRGLVAICSRRHGNEASVNFVKTMSGTDGDITWLVRGSSLKFCAVAEGSADVYPRFAPTMEWDSAAGQAIAEIAGARVLQRGTLQALQYNKPDLHNPDFVVLGAGQKAPGEP